MVCFSLVLMRWECIKEYLFGVPHHCRSVDMPLLPSKSVFLRKTQIFLVRFACSFCTVNKHVDLFYVRPFNMASLTKCLIINDIIFNLQANKLKLSDLTCEMFNFHFIGCYNTYAILQRHISTILFLFLIWSKQVEIESRNHRSDRDVADKITTISNNQI